MDLLFKLLITNGKVPIALAGIMGGYGSAVDDNTKNILIESAYIYLQNRVGEF